MRSDELSQNLRDSGSVVVGGDLGVACHDALSESDDAIKLIAIYARNYWAESQISSEFKLFLYILGRLLAVQLNLAVFGQLGPSGNV